MCTYCIVLGFRTGHPKIFHNFIDYTELKLFENQLVKKVIQKPP